MLWIFIVSSASSKVSGGRIVGSRFASMDFPAPGGPMSSFLWLISPALYLTRHKITDNQSQLERVNVWRLDIQVLFARFTKRS